MTITSLKNKPNKIQNGEMIHTYLCILLNLWGNLSMVQLCLYVCLCVCGWVCEVLCEVYRESFHIAYACKVQTVIPWVAGLLKQNDVSAR